MLGSLVPIAAKGVNSEDELVVVIVPAHNLLFNSKLMNF